jgi:hypothetical protein
MQRRASEDPFEFRQSPRATRPDARRKAHQRRSSFPRHRATESVSFGITGKAVIFLFL